MAVDQTYALGMQIAAENISFEESRRVFLQQVLGNVVGTAVTLLPAAALSARYGVAKGLLGGAAISGGLLFLLWLFAKKTGVELRTAPPPLPSESTSTKGVG